WDAVVKLSEIYLGVTHEKAYLDEVEGYCKKLLERDPNSYDGHRLTGDLDFARATERFSVAMREEGRALVGKSIEEYRKAEAIKPGQVGVVIQLARTLAAETQYAESEKLYRSVFEKDKTFQNAYIELYRLVMFQAKP